MFRALNPPIFRSIILCYSLWYNAPTMLPAGSLEAEVMAKPVPLQERHTVCYSLWYNAPTMLPAVAGNVVAVTHSLVFLKLAK